MQMADRKPPRPRPSPPGGRGEPNVGDLRGNGKRLVVVVTGKTEPGQVYRKVQLPQGVIDLYVPPVEESGS